MTETETNKDTRTMRTLAQEVINIQSAGNLSGLVHGWSRSISRLRQLLAEQGIRDTEQINKHPINKLWAERLYTLSGCEGGWVVQDNTQMDLLSAYDKWRMAWQECIRLKNSGQYAIKAGEPDINPTGEWDIVVSKGQFVDCNGQLSDNDYDAQVFPTEDEAKAWMRKWFDGDRPKEIRAASVVRFA